MTDYTTRNNLPEFNLWDRLARKRLPLGFDLELTARCNNDCRHCYINLPAGDQSARSAELSLEEINSIAAQAFNLGVVWVLLTGGEPLLRTDFKEIYLLLKKKGFLVSVFTNACPVTMEHVELFKRFPPRDIEVSVYGVTQKTYERVTRVPGSYAAFRRGLDLLLENGIKVTLKAMALKSNLDEFDTIADFCRQHSKNPYRFDPLLHLRYDGDPSRNMDIKSERLPADVIAALDQKDPLRAAAIDKECSDAILERDHEHSDCRHIFHCGAGKSSFTINYKGQFLLCSSLYHPDTVFNLRQGGRIANDTLREAWDNFVPGVLAKESNNQDFLDNCLDCPIINLCLYCPANAYLESGEMDSWNPYFCQVAHDRAEGAAIHSN